MSTPGYTEFHRRRMGAHLYPTEFLIRTMLGTYPGLDFDRDFAGRRLLDLGCGDGRNFPLFAQLGLQIFGVEPDEAVCAMVAARARNSGIACELTAGSNARIPFEDAFFDFVVAAHSIYYVEPERVFADALGECARVMQDGSWLIATVPDLDNYILRSAAPLDDGHFTITSDPFGLRNGTVFRAFASTAEISTVFQPWFERFSFASFRDDWYGILVSGFVVVAQRRARQSRASIS